MTISCGVGTQGHDRRILRFTISGSHMTEIQQRWGHRPRIDWSAKHHPDGSYTVRLAPARNGNIATVKHLKGSNGRVEYLTWGWSLKGRALAGMYHSRENAKVAEKAAWEGNVLVLTLPGRVGKEPPRQPEVRTADPTVTLALSVDTDGALRRVTALRQAINTAITELASLGTELVVTQSQAGGEITITARI